MAEKELKMTRSSKEDYAAALSIVLFVPRRQFRNSEEIAKNSRVWTPNDRPHRAAAIPNPILWYSSRPRNIKNGSNDKSKKV
jgi:hypothetical protein